MRIPTSLLSLAAAVVAVPSLAVAANAAPGRVILDARLRYETVDQDGLAKDAQALTLRTRLGYETSAWRGFKALVEAENVTALDDRYNSTINRKTAYPTVADPEATELNRAQISWAASKAGVVVGRQRIVLNNARFVGNVGFRQNEQTFDAVRLEARPAKDVTFTYIYVDKVHRVFGPDSGQGAWNSDSHIVQLDAPTRLGQVSAYGYLLDFANAPGQSSATYGVRLSGAHKLGGGRAVTYEAEYARQTDYGHNPARFDLDYVALGLGLKQGPRFATLGLERLDGDGRQAFQTPLATLHAYQGWADVFLTTPKAGVRDFNLRAGTSLKLVSTGKPLKLQLAVHDFAAAGGGQAYGREFDALASYPLTKRLSAELKAARFDGSSPAFPDRTKVWATLEFKL